ncbi:MAG TPA: helix-turn-helix domain-containing protein [Candidatus Thermoplasmatota archaeon]|nr:helix-turn-helix domain-containing protein [Candidatus Thermoplasmatota archaeon]
MENLTRGVLVAAVLLATTLATPAVASPPVEWTVPAPRSGDAFLYHGAFINHVMSVRAPQHGGGAALSSANVAALLVEDARVVVDGAGFPRDVLTFRLETFRTNPDDSVDPVRREQCHAGAHGRAVRHDIAWAEHHAWTSNESRDPDPLDRAPRSTLTSLASATFGHGTCILMPRPAPGLVVREGARLNLSDFEAGVASTEDLLSEPAVAHAFLDRRALSFRFVPLDPAAPDWTVTLVEGVPGVARLTAGTNGEFPLTRFPYALELVAYAAGEGPTVAFPTEETQAPPPRGRAASRALDERALALPYPFAEALRDAVADPALGLAAFLARHPHAALVSADYEREASPPPDLRHESSGGRWRMTFADERSAFLVEAYRLVGKSGALLPAKPALTRGWELPDRRLAARLDPIEAVDSSIVLRALEGLGIGKDEVHSVHYTRFAPVAEPVDESPRERSRTLSLSSQGDRAGLVVSTLPLSRSPFFAEPASGAAVDFDLETGRALALFRAERVTPTASLLDRFGPPPDKAAMNALAEYPFALSAPALLGVTGGAVLGRLGFGALYTRLRRRLLLEHPTRAAIHAVLVARPGLSAAALAEAAGVPRTSADHHLRQLVKHRVILRVEPGGYYVAGTVPPDVARREAALSKGARRAVYDLFVEEPALTLRAAARRLAMSAPAVHRTRAELRRLGFLP